MTDRMPFPARSPGRTRLLRLAPVSLAVAFALKVGSAWAVEPFVLKDIRVEGLQRTDAGTVFAALPFRIGDTYNDEKGAAALRALFATGLFKDVRIDIDNGVAVVIVDERSVIANIDFVGMKEFEKDALIKSLKDFGIGEGLPFDKALADRAEQELKRQYLTRSLYGAEIVTTVTPQERNRVNVTFTVTEGAPSKISEIRIVGNKVFSESTLKGLFELNDSSWLNFYLKNDRYSRAKLNADLETLRAYYLNRGYLEFEIESTQVAISGDKQDISITINVKEGQPYTVTAVRLEGQYFGREDEFKASCPIRPGEAYRGEAVAETTRAFVDRFGTFGYAFARIDARPDIDRAKGQVVVTLVAEPQRRVYVRRINVAGNTRTRDEVIRREFRQLESAWYDGRKIKLSRDRVDRLGYFSEVNVESNEVPGTPGPGRPDDHGQGKAHRRDLGRRRLLVGRQAVAHRPRSSRRTSSARATTSAWRSTPASTTRRSSSARSIPTSRSTASRARSTSTTAPPRRSTARARNTSWSPRAPRCASACRSASTTRCSSASASSAPRSAAATCRSATSNYQAEFGETSSSVPLTARLVARQPRQRPGADRRPLRPGQRRLGAAAATPSTCASTCRASSTSRSRAPVHLRRQRRDRLRQGPGRPALSDLQELLRRRPGHGARVRPGLARPGRRDRRLHRRQPALQHEQRALPAGARGERRPNAAHLPYGDIGNVWGEDEKVTFESLRASVGVGRQLDLPGGPAEAQLRLPDAQAAER